jgi:hypothetical protein
MIGFHSSPTLAACLFDAGLILACATSGLAAVHYVDVNSTNAAPPYTNWVTAATNIQDAVDAALAGDEIVVTNGVYATAGRAPQRVAVDRAVTLRSVNGPTFTIIDGGRAVRCVYLTNGAVLWGFTMTCGRGFGAGVLCESQMALVSNCILSSNVCLTGDNGGGANGGTLNNCALIGNMAHAGGGAANCILNGCFLSGNVATAHNEPGVGGGAIDCTLNDCALSENWADGQGGGAAECTLNNCTLTGNRAWVGGGGASGGTLNNCTVTGNSPSGVLALYSFSDYASGPSCPATLNNCIVYFNDGRNYDALATLNYCCTTPLPTNGVGNITAEPLFVDTNSWSNLGLQPISPCINAGNNSYAVGSRDLDGKPRINRGTVDIGAYEFQSTTHYVDLNSTNARPPFTNWLTAATNIQDAVDASLAGDEIVVTNGVYANGARAIDIGETNRVVVDKPLTMRSVNGPQCTIIDGGLSVGCAFVTNNATLVGLTLTNGYMYRGNGAGVFCSSRSAVLTNCAVAGNSGSVRGAGAFGGTLIGCILSDNSSSGKFGSGAGGGAYDSTLYDCAITNNSSDTGGGVSSCTLSNCTLSGNYARYEGGGAKDSFLSNCKLFGNVAEGVNADNDFGGGGGVSSCTLNNCALSGNYATEGGGAFLSFLSNCKLSGNIASGVYPLRGRGGGASESTLNNCTLTSNRAQEGEAGPLGDVQGGGAYRSDLYNCTLSGNSVTGPPEILVGGGVSKCTLKNCILFNNTNLDRCEDCSSPGLLLANQNWSGDPLFVDLSAGNLRLQSNSPCINAGVNSLAPAGSDLDGNPRVVGFTIDIGAYEFQSPASQISYAWLQQYGLPIDGSADTIDSDGDGLNNWQEWRCGTDPTNALSALRLLGTSDRGTKVMVTWQSVAGVSYLVQRSTNLSASSAFTTLATGIPGQPVTTTYTDTNALGAGTWFYRVGVGN